MKRLFFALLINLILASFVWAAPAPASFSGPATDTMRSTIIQYLKDMPEIEETSLTTGSMTGVCQ